MNADKDFLRARGERLHLRSSLLICVHLRSTFFSALLTAEIIVSRPDFFDRSLNCHPRESGDPGQVLEQSPWIPAFAGMTRKRFAKTSSAALVAATRLRCDLCVLCG
jgi:hypothetical protein